MKGLDISQAYFQEFGKPMLEEKFPELMPYLAAGAFGSGSECFGWDDELSRDHDFDPGFCIFLPGEDQVDRRTAFLLERAYAKLPEEFQGVRRPKMLPVGGARHGVFRTEEFFQEKTGLSAEQLGSLSRQTSETGQSSDFLRWWLTAPEQSLAEATNGRLFFDHFGQVAGIREALAFFPEDVRRKKLAGHLLLMAQAGQYNYRRCLDHGEKAAAQLAVGAFVKSAMSAAFLLNRRYQPYYKWSFRALRELPKLSIEAELMEYLLTTDNEPAMAEEKYYTIEGIAADVIEELMEQELTKAICGDLEKHAYSVNDSIADPGLRNLNILAGV